MLPNAKHADCFDTGEQFAGDHPAFKRPEAGDRLLVVHNDAGAEDFFARRAVRITSPSAVTTLRPRTFSRRMP